MVKYLLLLSFQWGQPGGKANGGGGFAINEINKKRKSGAGREEIAEKKDHGPADASEEYCMKDG